MAGTSWHYYRVTLQAYNIAKMTAEDYADQFTSPLNDLLQEVLRDTMLHPQAHMCSGHVQGQLLIQISNMLRPKRILEIGTFTGFSALCLAEGLANDGLLYTLELRDDDANRAQAYFDKSKHADKIKLLRGNAAEIIPTLSETFDLVFIDADKTGYIGYYEQVIPLLHPGAVILADNVLFHGEVLQEKVSGKSAKAIVVFNEHVRSDNRVEHVLLTVRDGLMLIRKK
jgi:caffeoyl-CoA O-methyltransferase